MKPTLGAVQLLELRNIRLSYSGVTALKGVNIKVSAGEVVTLIGANGAGKSSILKAISCLHPIASGEITYEGFRIDGRPAHSIVGLGISHCPEGRRIFYHLSVRENLMMGAFLKSDKEAVESMEQVLETFPRLKERIAQPGGTLSGGEQQMLAIGRALMSRPRLLMLDEPSLGLSPIMVEKIFEVLINLNRSGLTLLLVEQNSAFALKISQRAYVMETGEVAIEGLSSDLMRDEMVIKAYLGG